MTFQAHLLHHRETAHQAVHHLLLIVVQPLEHMFSYEILHCEQSGVEGYSDLVEDYLSARSNKITHCKRRSASSNPKLVFPSLGQIAWPYQVSGFTSEDPPVLYFQLLSQGKHLPIAPFLQEARANKESMEKCDCSSAEIDNRHVQLTTFLENSFGAPSFMSSTPTRINHCPAPIVANSRFCLRARRARVG